MSTKMHKNNKSLRKKNCGVCGDNAIGRNFGAITCESCKAFFRRTAFKSNALVCNTNGKCVINTQNRKSCKKCRLNKCLTSGMIKELILKNNENSSTKISQRVRGDSIGSSCDSNISSSDDSTLVCSDFDLMFENCNLSDEEINKEIMEIEEYINGFPLSVDSETEETLKISMAVVRPIATYNKGLNNIELNRLQELSTAANMFYLRCLSAPITQNIIEFSTLKEYYTNGLSLGKFDEAAREFVKFCKHLSSFQDICPDDQLALVKYGYMESSSWQHLVLYNFDEEYCVMPLANGCSLRFSLSLLKLENITAYNVIHNFINKLSQDLILDETLRNLLSVVSLFNPDRPKIKHRQLIKLKQQMYLYLLQKYLLQKYRSEWESMEKCSKMLTSLQELQIVTDVQKECEKEYKEFLTPLLREFIE